MEWHLKDSDNVIEDLGTSKTGLTDKEANQRLTKHGKNELKKVEGDKPYKIFLNQFKSVLIIILIIASILSAIIGDIVETIVILAIVIINAVLGFVQEYRAEKTISSLKKLVKNKTIVIREGKKVEIDVEDLVPGDIVILEAGDKVPADLRLIKSYSLKIHEAALTGESHPQEKTTEKLEKDVVVAEMKNMAFMGTEIVSGNGIGVVVTSGMETQLGNIASLVQEEKDELPIEIKMKDISRKIGFGVLAVAAVVMIAGFVKTGTFSFDTFNTFFLIAIALAVAAIPEGLPAVVTISLANGIQRMAKKNAVIRKLPAVETLGNVSVICTDKTGTLTRNEMTVKRAYFDHKEFEITGRGYEPKGNFIYNGTVTDPMSIDSGSLMLKSSILCNNAELRNAKIVGDPTEGALLSMAGKANLFKDVLELDNPRVYEVPFSSSRRLMSTVNGNKNSAHTKGSVESVLNICNRIMVNGMIKTLTDADKKKILDEEKKMASDALRVLAFSYKPRVEGKYNESNIESNQVFLGIVGMIDPPRLGVKESIEDAKSAGIRTIMVTGDNAETAKAIGKEIGLMKEGDDIIEGLELEKMTDRQLYEKIGNVSIFARVSPKAKMRIIDALKRHNHVVAMTGDGVNDAPALKKSDVGIAMGITGTDVSRDAADMILLDDNYSTIVASIEQGRGTYNNIQKFVNYLLSSNVGEVIAIFLGIMFAPIIPLLAIHILWVNLATDGLPAVSLGMDPIDKDVMKKKPRSKNKPILDKDTVIYILSLGLVIGLGTLTVFFMYLPKGDVYARTMAFTTLVVFQLFNAFNCRTDKSIFKKSILSNKFLLVAVLISLGMHLTIMYTPLAELFKVVSISVIDWLVVVGISASIILVSEVSKLILKENIIN